MTHRFSKRIASSLTLTACLHLLGARPYSLIDWHRWKRLFKRQFAFVPMQVKRTWHAQKIFISGYSDYDGASG